MFYVKNLKTHQISLNKFKSLNVFSHDYLRVCYLIQDVLKK